MVTPADMRGGPAAAAAAAQGLPLVVIALDTGTDHPRGPGVPQLHLACFYCGQSVMCLSPDVRAGSFAIDLGTALSHTTSHVLQCHEHMLGARHEHQELATAA